ncbi:MAG: hypothetical protein WBX25_30550 [Rhodomicrobium sp.]
MASSLCNLNLMPSGLTVEHIARVKAAIVLTVRAATYKGICPLSQSPSRRVHSRYVRRVSDLPYSGHSVHLRVFAATGKRIRSLPLKEQLRA